VIQNEWLEKKSTESKKKKITRKTSTEREMTTPQERFVNLTPHKVNVVTLEGAEYEFASEGLARIDETGFQVLRLHAGIEIRQTQYGAVVGLPPEELGVLYIVSSMVRDRLPERHDLVSPDSGKTCLRENGNIKATRGFLGSA